MNIIIDIFVFLFIVKELLSLATVVIVWLDKLLNSKDEAVDSIEKAKLKELTGFIPCLNCNSPSFQIFTYKNGLWYCDACHLTFPISTDAHPLQIK